jgi:hypothetical protein
MKRLLSFIACALVLVVGACGDHITVPADKSGKCVAGLLKRCGDTCVDTATDIANCGDCGQACGGAKVCVQGKCAEACPPGSTLCTDKCVNTDVDRTDCGMCGKACGGTDVCAKGKCVASCEAEGWLTCSGVTSTLDAGAAMNCVDPTRDQNNCGSCGHACQAAESCSNGLCCVAGHANCGGQCIDTQSDVNNCGACGVVCPMSAPSCTGGVCSKCRPSILILGDSQTAVNTNMKASFKAAGFTVVDVIDSGGTQYSGTPPASNYGAVMVIRGLQINGADMPMSGQQAIVTAQGQGTGVILDAFVSLEQQNNHLQTIKPLWLMSFGNGSGNIGGTVSPGVQQPFFYMLGSFGLVNPTYWSLSSPPLNSGTPFANFSNGTLYVGGYYRASPNGRIVHYGYAINYQQAANQWTNDNSMTQWTINGARYAANCIQ